MDRDLIAPYGQQCKEPGWVAGALWHCQLKVGYGSHHAAEPSPGETVTWSGSSTSANEACAVNSHEARKAPSVTDVRTPDDSFPPCAATSWPMGHYACARISGHDGDHTNDPHGGVVYYWPQDATVPNLSESNPTVWDIAALEQLPAADRIDYITDRLAADFKNKTTNVGVAILMLRNLAEEMREEQYVASAGERETIAPKGDRHA